MTATTPIPASNKNTEQLPETGWHDATILTGSLTVQLGGSVEIEHGKRYLLTVNPDGSPNVREIPWNAAIATQERYLEMMMEPNGCYVGTERLQAFVDVVTARLEQRRQFTDSEGGEL